MANESQYIVNPFNPLGTDAGVTRSLLSGVRFARDLRERELADVAALSRPGVPTETIYHTGMSAYKQVRRGILAHKHNPEKLYLFQFNPEEINDSKDVRYADVERPNRQYVDYVFSGGGARTLSFTLNLDATASSNTPEFTSTKLGNPGFETLDEIYPNGVMDDVQFLQGFLYPTLPDADAPRFLYGGAAPSEQFASPPTAVFVYGQLYFEGIVKSVNITHQLWDHRLISRRAEAQITFAVFEEELVRPNQSLRKSHYRK